MSLESEIRQVLGEMEVWLSYGSTLNLSPSRGGDGGDGRPTGDSSPAHVRWRARFEAARGDRLERLLEDARAELAGLLKQTRVTVVLETEGELEARIVREGNGWSVDDIATHVRCTPTFVRKARLKAGVSMITGKVPPSMAPPADESARAKQLSANGLSERQIRMILHCGGSKLARLLAA